MPFNNTIFWEAILLFCFWHIWLTSNHNIFNNRKYPISTVNTIAKTTEFYTIACTWNIKDTVPINVKWEPPLRGHYKLNTDRAAKGNPGVGGIGGIFRTLSGDWIIGYLENIPHTTNTLKELTALLEGIQIA
uniref:RNase H type-1 domain-containing protein n=1 Tax=Nicotiana tabacum TaxID=4097 RepID=A0A1S3XX84_TOBAC|nr:PREDICTED: uncharacterized protein LOC107769808 [Nicotiana tabacum]